MAKFVYFRDLLSCSVEASNCLVILATISDTLLPIASITSTRGFPFPFPFASLIFSASLSKPAFILIRPDGGLSSNGWASLTGLGADSAFSGASSF